MTIWLYWENTDTGKRPVYLDMCLETVKKHCEKDFEIRVVSRKEARQLLNPPEIWDKFIHPAHRSDFVRAGLLSKFGGMWLDSDLIIIQNLRAIERLVKRSGFVGYSPYSARRPEIGFLASTAQHPIITGWYDEMTEYIIEKNKVDFHWLEIGQTMLNKYTLNDMEWEDLHYSTFSPIRGVDKQLFFREDLDIKNYINPNTHGIMLFNKGFGNHPIKSMCRERILKHPSVLAQSLRLGLNV